MFECTRTNPFVGAASPILDKHDTQFSEGGDLDARRPLNGLAVLTAQEKQVAGDAKEGQQLPNNGGQKETVVEKTEPPLNHEKRASAGLRADEDKEILRDDLGEDGSGLGEGEDAGSAGATKGAMSHTWGGYGKWPQNAVWKWVLGQTGTESSILYIYSLNYLKVKQFYF